VAKDIITSLSNIAPAITLYQPWATWIMRGWKTIETREHNRLSSLLDNRILIHAGQRTDSGAIRNPFLTKEQLMENPDEIVNGVILGSAFVYKVSSLSREHEKMALIECTTKRWGLFLRNIVRFETPIPVKGEMGIWYFDLSNFIKVKKPKYL